MNADTVGALNECLEHLEWAKLSLDLGHDIDEEILAKFSWDILDIESEIRKLIE